MQDVLIQTLKAEDVKTRFWSKISKISFQTCKLRLWTRNLRPRRASKIASFELRISSSGFFSTGLCSSHLLSAHLTQLVSVHLNFSQRQLFSVFWSFPLLSSSQLFWARRSSSHIFWLISVHLTFTQFFSVSSQFILVLFISSQFFTLNPSSFLFLECPSARKFLRISFDV